MKKWCIAGISLFAVFLLILGSLNNVMGYTTVQSSHQQTIQKEINQKQVFFQTICDLANNKEIQRIILKSEMRNGIFPDSVIPVFTMKQLKQMYFLGLILSKFIHESRLQSMIRQYRLSSQEILKEVSTVREKDTTVNTEILQLKESECDCQNTKTVEWNYPAICSLLYPFAIVTLVLYSFTHFFILLYEIMFLIGATLQCFWFS
jgi:hypothetical protein